MSLDRLSSFGLLASIATRVDEDEIVFYSRADGDEDGFFVITPVFEKLMRFLALDT